MKTSIICLLCCFAAFGTAVAAPQLGLHLRDVDFKLAQHLGIDGGAYVLKVMPGSVAEKEGIKKFDVIVSWNDKKIASAKHLAEAAANLKTGEHKY